jgi:hypothetical protein
MDARSQIQENAARLRQLNEAINRTYAAHGDEWRRACAEFHRRYDELAFPGGLDRSLKELKEGDTYAVELAVTFLDVDAMFFRSGYIKEELIQRLKGADLSASQIRRLGVAILNVVDNRDCREFRRYCQLAKRVQTDALVAELNVRAAGDNPDVSRRARWVLEAMGI